MNKKLVVSICLALSIQPSFAGKPTDGTETNSAPKVMKYIGQTQGKVLPAESLVEKNALCRAEFPSSNSPARMATSEEMINSINDGTYQTIDYIALLKSTIGVNGATIDYSGSTSGDCMVASADHNAFIGVTNNGTYNKFYVVPCSSTLEISVACSAPQ